MVIVAPSHLIARIHHHDWHWGDALPVHPASLRIELASIVARAADSAAVFADLATSTALFTRVLCRRVEARLPKEVAEDRIGVFILTETNQRLPVVLDGVLLLLESQLLNLLQAGVDHG